MPTRDPEKLREKRKRYWAARPGLRAELKRIARANPLTWAGTALISLRDRCRRTNTLCTITIQDIQLPEKCPVLGTQFILGVPYHPYGPTIDRLNPAFGYTPGNVTVISRKANCIKSDCTNAEEILKVGRWLQEKLQNTKSLD